TVLIQTAGQTFVAALIDKKTLVEPRNFENREKLIADSGEPQPAAVVLNVLHGADQYRQARAIDEGAAGKIDHNVRGLPFGDSGERAFESRRNVKVDFTFKGQNMRRVRLSHWTQIGSRFYSGREAKS